MMLHAPLHAAVLLGLLGAVAGCGQLGFDELDASTAPDARVDAPPRDGGRDSGLVDALMIDAPPLADALPVDAPPTDGGRDAPPPDAPLVPDAGPADAGRDTGGLCEFDTDCTRCERCLTEAAWPKPSPLLLSGTNRHAPSVQAAAAGARGVTAAVSLG